MTIPRLPFGKTGHESSRILFGAAALGRVSQAEADRALEGLLEAGVNHIDTAAAYGDSELRVGAWMDRHRGDFFLATKTGDRSYAGARDSLRRSLERLRVDHVDLLQFHNLVDPEQWEEAMGDEGALRAAVEAREEGLVRFIGMTGHGTRVAQMHRRSLERFDFDSVLLPYNHSMMMQPAYAAEFQELLAICLERGVAVQTIKSIARRRWREGEPPAHGTWYVPFTGPGDVTRGIHYALGCKGVFVNCASALRLLDMMLNAAAAFDGPPPDDEMLAAHERLGVEPLFVHGHASASA